MAISKDSTKLQRGHILSANIARFNGGWGSNLKPYTYFILFIPTELSS